MKLESGSHFGTQRLERNVCNHYPQTTTIEIEKYNLIGL